jgi:hypothetical protein
MNGSRHWITIGQQLMPGDEILAATSQAKSGNRDKKHAHFDDHAIAS